MMFDEYEVDDEDMIDYCRQCGVELTWSNTSVYSKYVELCHKCDNDNNS